MTTAPAVFSAAAKFFFISHWIRQFGIIWDIVVLAVAVNGGHLAVLFNFFSYDQTKKLLSNIFKSQGEVQNVLINENLTFFWQRHKTAGAAVNPLFFINLNLLIHQKKILFQYIQKHRRSTEFKIYLDKREFEKKMTKFPRRVSFRGKNLWKK